MQSFNQGNNVCCFIKKNLIFQTSPFTLAHIKAVSILKTSYSFMTIPTEYITLRKEKTVLDELAYPSTLY